MKVFIIELIVQAGMIYLNTCNKLQDGRLFFQSSPSGVLEEAVTGPVMVTVGPLLPVAPSYKVQLWDTKQLIL